MGGFFNIVFSILLGWMQGLAALIWNTFTLREGESFLTYLGKNWITIAAILCVTGLAADFAVYIFRWEPYKVWATFWRKTKRGKEKTETDEEPAENIRPDTEKAEDAPAHSFYSSEMTDAGQERGEEDDELRRWRDPEPEALQDRGDSEAMVTKAGYVVRADSPYRPPSGKQPDLYGEQEKSYARGKTSRRRRRFSAFIGDNEDENMFRYITPKPMIDHRDAYLDPVYPKKWEESRGKGP